MGGPLRSEILLKIRLVFALTVRILYGTYDVYFMWEIRWFKRAFQNPEDQREVADKVSGVLLNYVSENQQFSIRSLFGESPHSRQVRSGNKNRI